MNIKYFIGSVFLLFSAIAVSQPADDMENWFIYPEDHHIVYFENGEYMGPILRSYGDSTNYYVEYEWDGETGYIKAGGGNKDVLLYSRVPISYTDEKCKYPTISKDMYETYHSDYHLSDKVNFLAVQVVSGQWEVNRDHYLYKLDFVNVITLDIYQDIMDPDTGIFECKFIEEGEVYSILQTIDLGASGTLTGTYVDKLP